MATLSAQDQSGSPTSTAHTLTTETRWDGRPVIAGARMESWSGGTHPKLSPVDGELVTPVGFCGVEEVALAVRSARGAFQAGTWSRSAPRHRVEVMSALSELMARHRDDLAILNTVESGKPIGDARAEVDRAVLTMAFFAESIDKVAAGEVAPVAGPSMGLVLREPVGVVAAITPWNYPLTMPTWKLAPALAAGNSVVLKPAEQAPLSALYLADLATQAGLPPGVLSVLPGAGEVAGAALGRHNDVDALTFTGSTEVGKAFLRYAGESTMKSVSLECGGKSPQVVFPDALDLAETARQIAAGAFSNAGQMCNAGSRLLVHRSIAPALTQLLIEEASSWRPADPHDSTTRMGAIIDERQLDSIARHVAVAQHQGATIAYGGCRAREDSGGTYFEPTIFANCDAEMGIVKEEVFGPVLAVQEFESEAQAMSMANNTDYGLAAAVWTADMARAHRAVRQLRAGNVYVNSFDRSAVTMPFGGHGQSGIGVDQSLHALDKYTVLKSVWIELAG